MMQKIKEEVLNLYMSHPFPMWDKKERKHRLSAELCRYRFLGPENALPGAKLLEVGCGTETEPCLQQSTLGVKEFNVLIKVEKSLKVAKQVAREEKFEKQFNAVEGDLFNLPFEDNSFDVGCIMGVLHHTDPFLVSRKTAFLNQEVTLVCSFTTSLTIGVQLAEKQSESNGRG